MVDPSSQKKLGIKHGHDTEQQHDWQLSQFLL